MEYLTLPQIKKHLNIDDYYEGDDTYLTSLGDVCEQIAEQHIQRPLSELSVNGEIPAPIIQAMLLFLGTLYMNRESVSYGQAYQIPAAYTNTYLYLLDPYINYTKSAR